MLFAAVRLFHGDFQIAASAGGVEIVNLERAGSDIVLVNDVTILANDNLGVTVRRTADHRRKALHAVREHVVIRGDLRPGVRDAVKYVERGRALAECDVAAKGDNIALGVGIDRRKLALCVTVTAGFAPGGVVTKTPRPEVKTRTQVKKLAALIATVFTFAAVVPGGEAVIEQQGVNSLVILLRVDVITRYLDNRGLGNA